MGVCAGGDDVRLVRQPIDQRLAALSARSAIIWDISSHAVSASGT
jgi:hypothetical protein